MSNQEAELFKRIQEQFDYIPYPVTEIDNLPTDRASLYYHCISTAFYRRNREIVRPEGKTILDVGCGSGYKTLLLALANPGAKIVGVDLSDRSLDIARQRFAHHKLEAEFHNLSILDIPQKLLQDFDYINCDEVLYLMPNPTEALLALKLVLKPEGILRGNLHSVFQRSHYYRAQRLFQVMGLMDENPEEEAIQEVVSTFKGFKPNVDLKKTWKPEYEGQHQKHAILMNYLFQGDKGFTIPDMFDLLRSSEMQLISMVNWKHWNVLDLFDLRQHRPFQGKILRFSTEQLLHLFELCHPIHRLLDFWCGHPIPQVSWSPIEDSLAIPQDNLIGATVQLHPQLKHEQYREFLVEHVVNFLPCDLTRLIPLEDRQLIVNSSSAAVLLLLWDGVQEVSAISRYWQELHSVNPITKEPTTDAEALDVVGSLLRELEQAGYIFLDHGTP